MKRLFAILLALIMIMSLAITAFADETKGTIVNSTTRTYDAYQIFTGTQAEGNAVLGDIDWGNGINSNAFLTELKTLRVGESTPFATCTDAASVAAVLKDKDDNSAIAKAFANLANKHKAAVADTVAASTTTTLNSGYYLLVDTSEGNTTQNPALLQVTNNSSLSITDKTPGVPTPDKTIQGEGEAATAGISDTITFVLTATMPQSLEGYDSYKLVFHDTLSAGLDYVEGSAVVKIGNNPVTNSFTIAENAGELTVSCNDILAAGATAGSVITVTYNVTLTENVIIGSAGNTNTVYLEYSSDPNWTGTPGDDDEPTEDTTTDVVKVFTFELDVTKVDGQTKTPLANAEFVLLNSDQSKVATVVDGKLTGWTAVPDPGNDNKITWPANTILTSASNTGEFKILGLDEGTYKLKEIKAPAGYNLLTAPVDIVITAGLIDTEDEQTLNTLTINVGDNAAANGDTASGIVSASVENNAGSTLPETGGMGTTLFYIIGGLMMVAAVVLLVTKKRMASAE